MFLHFRLFVNQLALQLLAEVFRDPLLIANPQTLYQRHVAEINSYLRRCGHSRDDAEDLTQEVFTRLLSTARPLHRHHLRAYLYTVARNLSTDVYRRQQIAPVSYVPQEHYCDVPDPTPSLDRVVFGRQQLTAVHNALAALPVNTRHAFELYHFGDFTIADVAAKLNLSISRAWVLVKRATLHVHASLHECAVGQVSNHAS